jgi:hypothetical protein
MGRRESPLEARAVRWARWRGIVTAKLTGCDGIPDRVFFVPGGRPVVGEFKAEGAGSHGTRATTQPWYLEKLRADGYDAHKWDTWEKFIEAMKGRGYD